MWNQSSIGKQLAKVTSRNTEIFLYKAVSVKVGRIRAFFDPFFSVLGQNLQYEKMRVREKLRFDIFYAVVLHVWHILRSGIACVGFL